jgi:L-ribulose-5-phosphate 3-epimerase
MAGVRRSNMSAGRTNSAGLVPRGSIPIVGFAARLFGGNRSAVQEVEFGRDQGFGAIQFRGQVEREKPTGLGDLDRLATALQQSGLVPTMELLIGLHDDGRTQDGRTPLEVLQANLPIVESLGVILVHWHLYPLQYEDPAHGERLGQRVGELCRPGVELAACHQFVLGIENNPANINLLSTPQTCGALLDEAPGLHLVWDINHSPATQDEGYHALVPHLAALHVSDTPLPVINHHLPLGMGTVDVGHHLRTVATGGFRGPAILEIGGLPISGGYGRDTDEALIQSLQHLLVTSAL